ncbi:MAG TPA: hypothetical protein VMY05_06005 [Acidobacteriota bacterium]|nr:hypothetical protein [Acidobacteriota bacterium]
MRLIDEAGVPSEELRSLVQADADSRRAQYRELFERTYSFLGESGIDIAQTTPDQLNNGFQEAGATGDTVAKCRSFFVALAKEAGAELSPYLKRMSRERRTTKRRSPRKGTKPMRPSQPANGNRYDQSLAEPSAKDVLIDILDPDQMTEEEQKAVWTLILYLKKRETADEEQE